MGVSNTSDPPGWVEYFRDAKPATTTVQVVRLATDPRRLCLASALVAAAAGSGIFLFARRRPGSPHARGGGPGPRAVADQRSGARLRDGRTDVKLRLCHLDTTVMPLHGTGLCLADRRRGADFARCGSFRLARNHAPTPSSCWRRPPCPCLDKAGGNTSLWRRAVANAEQ